jgi:hypothetical protein
LKAIDNAIDPESNDDPEELLIAQEKILDSVIEFTIDMRQGIKIKHILDPDGYVPPKEKKETVDEEIHSDGMFDCFSPLWAQVFEEMPNPDVLKKTYMESQENFVFAGMYMFCNDVRSEEYTMFSYYYDPGVFYTESARCSSQKDVIKLQKQHKKMNEEYAFWINFNDWLSNVYDSYSLNGEIDDNYTSLTTLDSSEAWKVDPSLYVEVTEEKTKDETEEDDKTEEATPALDMLDGAMP